MEHDIISTRTVNYLLFSVGLLPYYLLPIWAGIFSDSFGFNGSQIGPLLAADMIGGTIAAAGARLWIARARWRNVLLFTLLLCVVANFLCALFDSFAALLMLRTVAGLAAGSFMAIVYADFAHADNADREFSIALALQVLFGAAAIAIAPHIIASWGRTATFQWVGFVTLLPLFLAPYWPSGSSVAIEDEIPPISRLNKRVWLGLAAICLFFLSLTCVWVAMERLASAQGMDGSLVAIVLSAGLLFSFLGAAAPALTSRLVARRTQIMLSYVALLAAILVIGDQPATWLFAAGLAVYNFFFSFVIPFQTAWVAETDGCGANAVLVPFAQGLGVSVGPVVGGVLLGAGNHTGVIFVSIALLLGGMICAIAAGDPIEN